MVSTSSGRRPSKVRYKVMAFLCVLSFLTYFDRVCIVRAQGDIQRDLSLSVDQMGLVLGSFWLAYALFEIPGGWLGDTYGARLTLTRIVLFWSAFTMLTGSAAGFVSILTFRILFGAGEAGAYPNIARVQSAWLPLHSRARAGGLIWLVARWGGAFSPFLFGYLLRLFDSPSFRDAVAGVPALGFLQDTASWRLGFWAAGLAGFIWCVAFFFWFRDDPAKKRSVNDAELALIRAGTGDRRGERPPDRTVWKSLVLSPSLWAIGFLYIFASFGWSFFVSWSPKYLASVHEIQFDDRKSELFTGLPLFAGGISCLAGGWLCDSFVRRTGRKRLGRALFPVCGYLTAASAMFCLRFVDTPEEALALMCIAGAANDFGQGANWATIVDIGGEFAGTAAGFINTVGNMGNAIQPWIGAKVFDTPTLGWPALFAMYAGSYLCAASMWLFIDPRKRFHGAAAPAGQPPMA